MITRSAIDNTSQEPSDGFVRCCFVILYFSLALVLALKALLSICFLILIFSGVISSSSSSARNSRLSSRLSLLGGTSLRASSEPLARVLVRCFFFFSFSTRSSAFGDALTIMSLRTGVPDTLNTRPCS